MFDITDSTRDDTDPTRAAHVDASLRPETRDELAGAFAHEFNTLLGVILSYVSLVSSELDDAVPGEPERGERIRRDVEQIQLAAQRGADLTRRLSAFAENNIVRPEQSGIHDSVASAPLPPAIETVLLVEDTDPLREATRRLLVRNGYEVITAANGRDAIEVAASHAGPIDLLLTDVIMPQMLGIEVAQRITDARAGIRVLFMSGDARRVVGAQGRPPLGVVMLEKPFSESALLSKVREVLDDKRPSPSPRVAERR